MRIVVKVGTSTLAYKTGHINIRIMEKLCRVLSDIKNSGHQVILVSSGAVGMGMGKLSLGERPSELSLKQAAAAVGQCELMYTYDKLFSQYNHTVAQILLTADDIHDPRHSTHVHDNLEQLLAWNVLPVVNENDAVSIDEIGVHTTIGENDTLAAYVARLVKADTLVLLSDIDGLYTADPHKDAQATLIPEVKAITPEILELAGGSGTSLGTGGMTTKLKAAQIVMPQGIDMIIANGQNPEILYGLMENKSIGTRFVGEK